MFIMREMWYNKIHSQHVNDQFFFFFLLHKGSTKYHISLNLCLWEVEGHKMYKPHLTILGFIQTLNLVTFKP